MKSWKPQKPPFRKYKKDIFEKVGATGEFIYQIGDSALLRQSSQEVLLSDIKTPDFQKKIIYLKNCMKKYRQLTGLGRGITGVQVGIPERFAVIFISKMDSGQSQNGVFKNVKDNLLIIINPHVIKTSQELLKYPEICMSANPLIAPVVRPAWIEFEYYDERGQKKIWDAKDTIKEGRLYNRVFQHEIDHMDGIINIDRVQSKELLFELDPDFYEKATFEKVTINKNKTS